VIITMQHVRKTTGFSRRVGLCARGTRAWFKKYNLDYSDFLKNGIDEEVLLSTGDAFAVAVVEQAHGKL
jgi:hypothetical protein